MATDTLAWPRAGSNEPAGSHVCYLWPWRSARGANDDHVASRSQGASCQTGSGAEALDLFVRFADQAVSYTDAVSFVLMRRADAGGLPTMNVRIHGSIDEIPAQRWDAVLRPGDGLKSHAHLCAIERSGIIEASFSYPVVHDDGRILGHAVVYAAPTDLVLFARGPLRSLVRWIRRVCPQFLRMTLLECGLVCYHDRGLSIAPGADEEAVGRLLVGAIESIADRLGIRLIVLRDFEPRDPLLSHVERLGYTVVPNLPNAVLDVRWDSFEEYLADLRSHYRTKARRHLKDIRDLTVETRKDFAGAAPELARQFKTVYDGAKGYQREILTEAYYVAIGGLSRGESEVLALTREGTMVAHGLLVREGPDLKALFMGKSDSGSDGVYLGLLYETIRRAIGSRVRQLDLGGTSYKPKRDVGARMVPLSMGLKVRVPLLGTLVPWLYRQVNVIPPVASDRIFHSGRPDLDRPDPERGEGR